MTHKLRFGDDDAGAGEFHWSSRLGYMISGSILLCCLGIAMHHGKKFRH